MDYEVIFFSKYVIKNAKDKWEAVERAENIFKHDIHPEFDIDINPIGDDDD